jgi:leader peptidase (prepilin peptidase)/N-methyltransferase
MALLGLIVGSFLNVVVVRLPRMMLSDNSTLNLMFPRSFCLNCQTPIKIIDNIPILSFLLLKGKCRTCKHAFSWRYPLIEILTALLSVFTAYYFGPTAACIGALFFTWTLIALTFIDLETQLLPDRLTQPLLWLGILFNYFGLFCSLENSILGAMIGYLSFWFFTQLFYLVRKKEGMGQGDFKLLAAIGAWLGWQALPLVVLIASSLGCVIGIWLLLRKKLGAQEPIAFGPFLAVSAWISLIWHAKILSFYQGL